MFISISYVPLCVFIQCSVIKWPYQPKHSPGVLLWGRVKGNRQLCGFITSATMAFRMCLQSCERTVSCSGKTV